MDTKSEILNLLDETLSLRGRALATTSDTPLMGAVPELDSMAVVALITGMEERFGFSIADDEVEGTIFTTLGSLVAFVDRKLAA